MSVENGQVECKLDSDVGASQLSAFFLLSISDTDSCCSSSVKHLLSLGMLSEPTSHGALLAQLIKRAFFEIPGALGSSRG